MEQADVTYERMAGSLGSLLLLWARAEKALRSEIECLNEGVVPKSAHGPASCLTTWERLVVASPSRPLFAHQLAAALVNRVREALCVRNGLCHGLLGISPSTAEMDASLMWELNGERRSITHAELQQSYQWLSRVPSAISHLTRMPADRLGTRLIDNLENRAWWQTEFGLIPPSSEHTEVVC